MARLGWTALSAVYRRRLEKAGITHTSYDQGTSLATARGHRTASLTAAHKGGSPITPASEQRVYNAVERMARGESLSQAARAEHVAPETVRRVARERGYIGKQYRTSEGGRQVFDTWQVSAGGTGAVLTTDGRSLDGLTFDLRNLAILGTYWSAVGRLLDHGDPQPLRAMAGTTVVDRAGNRYHLETNPNAVIRWWQTLTDDERRRFERPIGSEKVVVPRGRAA